MAFSSKHPHLSGILFDINPLFLPTEIDLDIGDDYDLTHANKLLEFDYEYLVETKCLTEEESESTKPRSKSTTLVAQDTSNETKSLNDQQQTSSDVNDKPSVAVAILPLQPILPSTSTTTNTPVNINHNFIANSQNQTINIAQQKSALSSNSTSSIYTNSNNQPIKSSSPVPIPIPVVPIVPASSSSSSAQIQLQSSPINHVNIPKPSMQQQLQLQQQTFQPTSLPTAITVNNNNHQQQQLQYLNHNNNHTTILQPMSLTKQNSQRSNSMLNMPLSFNSNELLIPTKKSEINNSTFISSTNNNDSNNKQPVNNQTAKSSSNEQQQQQNVNTNSTTTAAAAAATTNSYNNNHKRYDHLFLEHATLDPFNDMELKTINDIEELRSILQHSTFTSSTTTSSTILPSVTDTTSLAPLTTAITNNPHDNTTSKLSVFHNLDINSNNLSVIESKK